MGVAAFSSVFDRLDRELWIVTARSGERVSGLVATYVSRVSLVPDLPRVTIALAKHHYTHELIEISGAFCMHLIDETQLDWVWRFGIQSGRDAEKMHGLAISTGASGAPILSDAIGWVDCRVEARLGTGDRTIFLGDVLDARCAMPEAGKESFRSQAAHSQEPCENWAEPLTIKRMLELAPSDRLQELKTGMGQDIDVDRAAILEWRRGQTRQAANGPSRVF